MTKCQQHSIVFGNNRLALVGEQKSLDHVLCKTYRTQNPRKEFVTHMLDSNTATARKTGIDALIGLGWTRQEIASEIHTSIDNLRHLTRRDAPYSEAGIRLDKLLQEHDVDRRSAQDSPQAQPSRANMMREQPPAFEIGRMVPLPSAEQIEEMRLLARRAGRGDLMDDLNTIGEQVLSLLEETYTIRDAFANIAKRIRRTKIKPRIPNMDKKFR